MLWGNIKIKLGEEMLGVTFLTGGPCLERVSKAEP